MAVDQQVQVALGLRKKAPSEFENLLDMGRLRRLLTHHFLDDVVEADFQPRVLAIGAEMLQILPVGVEDRQHMAYLPLGVAGQFFDAANGNEKRRDGLHGYVIMHKSESLFLIMTQRV